jgi:sugar phosphate isomerase/epimerase
MRSISRRHFLARCGASAAAAAGFWVGTGRLRADPLGLPIGLQVYTVRDQLTKDFAGTLKKIADAGYQEVELFTFFNKKARDVRKALDAAGLACVSAHFAAQELDQHLGKNIDYARDLGLTYVVCPFPGLAGAGGGRAGFARILTEGLSADDWKWNADLFNKAGEQATKAGLRFAYHNHNLEFKKYDGRTGLDLLLGRTDPDHVKLEVDCGWVKVAGHDPAAFVAKHADRIVLLHIKDVKAGYGPTTKLAGRVPFTEVGHGSIDWKKVFQAAKRAKVKRYYVEQDTTERPPLEAIKISRDFLHDLRVS